MSNIISRTVNYVKRKKIKRIRPDQPASVTEHNDAYKKLRSLPDDRLYADNEFCLDYLRQNMANMQESQKNTGQIFHAYWQGLVGEKQAFSIKSVLATQANSKVWLWIDKKSWEMNVNNPILDELNNYIEIKCYDIYAEIKHTPFESFNKLHWSQYFDLALRADTFRVLILEKYKGVYFDLDIFFLRDMGQLYRDHIAYCWENQHYCNSALLFFNSEKITENIAETVKETGTFIPWVVFNYNNKKIKDLLVYPCAFFDPVWNITNIENYSYPIQSFDEFFTKKCTLNTYKEFFPGAYAYHWHNRWNMTPIAGSFFDVFNKELSREFNANRIK